MSHLSEQERIDLAHAILALFEAWKIAPEQQVRLLGLAADTRPRFLQRYRDGSPFPDEQELLQRAEHFLEIDSALLTTFPHNSNMGKTWLKTPNQRFANQTPLTLMLSGLEGIMQVKCHLDCTHNWI